MADTGVAGVPVVEADKKVAGVISEKDFLSRMGAKNTKSFMGVVSECLKAKGCVAVSIRGQNAEDIMTSPAVTVHEDTSVTEIAKIFSEKNINRVPVTDKNRHLVGIISRADIVRVPVINVKTWP
jgi:CBS domain-containing protein